MIDVIRTFHPVGHGAFYTEEIWNNRHVVYDCGGSTKWIIENRIRSTFQEGQKVDLVFISHFHNDHINGLEFLLRYTDVQKVVLPFLSDAMKMLFIIENIRYRKMKPNDFLIRLITDPHTTLDNQAVLVKPANEEDEVESTIVNHTDLTSTIASNTRITVDSWVYVPVNFHYGQYAEILKEELKKIDVTPDNIIQMFLTKEEQIIKIYERILRGRRRFNANSMTVYSGYDSPSKSFLLSKASQSRVLHEKVGCLYLGDFEAKSSKRFRKLKQSYSQYWSEISTVQIPHHGSAANFHPDLCWPNSIAVISANGRYNLPASSVVDRIRGSGANLYTIDQEDDSYVRQYIGHKSTLSMMGNMAPSSFREVCQNYPEVLL